MQYSTTWLIENMMHEWSWCTVVSSGVKMSAPSTPDFLSIICIRAHDLSFFYVLFMLSRSRHSWCDKDRSRSWDFHQEDGYYIANQIWVLPNRKEASTFSLIYKPDQILNFHASHYCLLNHWLETFGILTAFVWLNKKPSRGKKMRSISSLNDQVSLS